MHNLFQHQILLRKLVDTHANGVYGEKDVKQYKDAICKECDVKLTEPKNATEAHSKSLPYNPLKRMGK